MGRLGIAAIVLSLALGATLIRVTNAELRRIAAGAPADDQRWPMLQRRATTLFAINLLLLLSAVWAMEFSLNPPRLRALYGVLAGREPFGTRRRCT